MEMRQGVGMGVVSSARWRLSIKMAKFVWGTRSPSQILVERLPANAKRSSHLRFTHPCRDPLASPTELWPWIRRIVDRCSHQSSDRSESFRKSAVFIITMSDKLREYVTRKAHDFNGYEFSGRTTPFLLLSVCNHFTKLSRLDTSTPRIHTESID